MSNMRVWFPCLAAFCLALPPQSFAQTASGKFESQGAGSIAPKVAAAYVVRDQFNPRRTQVEVILSTTVVDVAKAAADLSPHVVVINDAALKDTNCVLIWISSDGKVSMNATFSKTMRALPLLVVSCDLVHRRHDVARGIRSTGRWLKFS